TRISRLVRNVIAVMSSLELDLEASRRCRALGAQALGAQALGAQALGARAQTPSVAVADAQEMFRRNGAKSVALRRPTSLSRAGQMRSPSSREARWKNSFGAWIFSFGKARPQAKVPMPSISAKMAATGKVPPERTGIGFCPQTRSMAVEAAR